MMFTCMRCLADTSNDNDMCDDCREETMREANPQTDITIPPESLEAGVRAAIAADSGPEGSKLFEIHWAEFADSYREGIRAAFLAMLKAWPGMAERRSWDGSLGRLILPLTEKPDAE